MITVKKVAEAAGVTSDAVRHYVRIGLLKPERHPGNHYQLFTKADVQRVRFIRQAQFLGYALEEIREIFDHASRGNSPCGRVRELIESRIERNRQRIEELGALQRRMETALKRWKDMPDGAPDGHSICHLIESENHLHGNH